MDYLKTIFLAVIGWVLSYFAPIQNIIIMFAAAFVVDFITGLMASFKKGQRFKSSKARWSFAKLVCYIGVFVGILVVGVELGKLNEGDSSIFMFILKLAVYAAIWFEAKSITENCCIVWPDNRFLHFLDFVLGVEFAKKIPGLSDFLKEDKDKHDSTTTR